jgi:hypothetical protein
MTTEIDKMIQKLELAMHHNAYLTFDEMEEMHTFLHKLKENSPRPAIFSEQYDLFTK